MTEHDYLALAIGMFWLIVNSLGALLTILRALSRWQIRLVDIFNLPSILWPSHASFALGWQAQNYDTAVVVRVFGRTYRVGVLSMVLIIVVVAFSVAVGAAATFERIAALK